jgi:hypothetical protein
MTTMTGQHEPDRRVPDTMEGTTSGGPVLRALESVELTTN